MLFANADRYDMTFVAKPVRRSIINAIISSKLEVALMSKKKLLITGAAGDIGSILVANLPSDRYDLVLADIRESDYI